MKVSSVIWQQVLKAQREIKKWPKEKRQRVDAILAEALHNERRIPNED